MKAHFVRRTELLLLLACLLLPAFARAADDPQPAGSQELSNPFSDFVPFEDEYDLDEDERFMYFGRFFAVSVGTGLHRFGGNIGKVYNTALPVMDFRLLYFFDFRLAGQFGFGSSSHAFTKFPDPGAVTIKFMRLNADLKYYFNTKNVGAAITSANPYVIGGVSQNFRSQTFGNTGETQKDTAVSVSGGLGMEFTLKPRKSAFGLEGRMHHYFFSDQLTTAYQDAGIEDQTGAMFSLLATLTWFF